MKTLRFIVVTVCVTIGMFFSFSCEKETLKVIGNSDNSSSQLRQKDYLYEWKTGSGLWTDPATGITYSISGTFKVREDGKIVDGNYQFYNYDGENVPPLPPDPNDPTVIIVLTGTPYAQGDFTEQIVTENYTLSTEYSGSNLIPMFVDFINTVEL